MIVDNKPGAGGTLAGREAARAEPDGYTLLFGSSAALAIGPALYGNSGYDPIKSFTPIAIVSSVPYVMIGATNAPFKTVPELLAYAKANPGKINFGVPNGAPPHMLAEMFKMQTGADIQVVPYRGASTLITDMLAGRIHGGFETTSVMLAHLNDGHIRGLAVLRDSRIPALPDVPTMTESGVNGVMGASWSGLLAPAGTPQPHHRPAARGHARGAAVAGIRGQAPRHVRGHAEHVGCGIRRLHRRRTPAHRRNHEGGRCEGAMTMRPLCPPGAGGYSLGAARPVQRGHRMKRLILLSLVLFRPRHSAAQNAPTRQELAVYAGLHEAAAKGDVAEIEKLIKDGEKPNIQDSKSRTPLHVAAYMKQHAAAKALLALGANPNALEIERYDIVTIAAVANDLEMLKIAIEGGASARNITSRYDGTALIAAAHLGHAEVVKMLIAAKAPLNHVNNLGWTALMESIVLGNGGANHTATLKALVEAGADVNIADRQGATPLQHARRRGYVEMARILENAGAQMRTASSFGRSRWRLSWCRRLRHRPRASPRPRLGRAEPSPLSCRSRRAASPTRSPARSPSG